jgi:hypothetical protein
MPLSNFNHEINAGYDLFYADLVLSERWSSLSCPKTNEGFIGGVPLRHTYRRILDFQVKIARPIYYFFRRLKSFIRF